MQTTEKRKKLCLVVSSTLSVNCFLLPHLQELSKRYEVTLIVNSNGENRLSLQPNSVRVIHVEIERNVSFRKDFFALVAIIQIFFRERFDLVHSISPKAGLLAMIASSMVGTKRRVHTFQGEVWVTRKGVWRFILKSLDRLVAYLSTDLLVVSRSEQQFLREQNIIPKGKSIVLGSGSICGVDIDRFRLLPDERKKIRSHLGVGRADLLFLFLGRLNIDKGVLELAEAFNQLAQHYLHIQILFVGPDEEGMKMKIKEICSSNSVSRLHFSNFSVAPEKELSAADIIVLPSHREGFGMVVIEAAAIGVPAIASRIYGISDALIDEQTGLLFEVENVLDLAGKMERLVRSPDLVRQLGDSAQQRVKKEFSQQRIVAATLDFYAALLSSS